MPEEPPSGPRRLRKSHDSKIGGVAGGLADYFELDPALARVLWVVALFIPAIGFGAVIAYIVMWFIMPEPEGEAPSRSDGAGGAGSGDGGSGDGSRGRGGGIDASLLLGVVIVAFGLLLLPRQSWIWTQVFGWGGFSLFWPAVLILLGAFIIYSARRRN